MKETKQQSMFATEHDFNVDDFKASILNSTFEKCIKDGVITGLCKTQERFQDGNCSMSVISHCLHEDVFNAIKDELSTQMHEEHFYFTSNISGNERLLFKYKDYVFIIKLADRTQNKTKQENRIRNQELDCHIISIVYTLDLFRENIKTLSLQYIKGKTVTWVYPISMQDIPNLKDTENDEVKIIAQKPKLKKENANKEAI